MEYMKNKTELKNINQNRKIYENMFKDYNQKILEIKK